MNALRINPSNQNIMRDLSFLQVQLRDFDSFVKTRRTILEAKPALRTNWVALAMAHYNAGEFDAAFQVVTKCNEVNLDGADDVSAYDASELLLFQNRCLEKQLLYQEALDHLNEIEPKIVDKLSYHVKVAELLQLLGKYNESKEKWLFLLQDQPENYRFHAGLHAAHLQLDGEQSLNTFALSKMELPSSVFVLTDDQKKSLLEMYQSNETLNQRFAQTVNRKICLSLLSSAEIGASLEIHMKICLRKGIPALYHDICALATMPSYSDPTQQVLCKDPVDFRENSVIKMTMEIISGYAKNLRSANTFDGAASPTWEPPSALLWTMFLQCHLYERCGELDKALLLINECLEHTPTATDL
jgi:peptide alpha-N-acetyltransferase